MASPLNHTPPLSSHSQSPTPPLSRPEATKVPSQESLSFVTHSITTHHASTSQLKDHIAAPVVLNQTISSSTQRPLEALETIDQVARATLEGSSSLAANSLKQIREIPLTKLDDLSQQTSFKSLTQNLNHEGLAQHELAISDQLDTFIKQHLNLKKLALIVSKQDYTWILDKLLNPHHLSLAERFTICRFLNLTTKSELPTLISARVTTLAQAKHVLEELEEWYNSAADWELKPSKNAESVDASYVELPDEEAINQKVVIYTEIIDRILEFQDDILNCYESKKLPFQLVIVRDQNQSLQGVALIDLGIPLIDLPGQPLITAVVTGYWNADPAIASDKRYFKGIGSALVEEAISLSFELSQLGTLRADATKTAENFYATLGFSKIKYLSSEDLMEYSLESKNIINFLATYGSKALPHTHL